MPYNYFCTVIRWIDGDTLEVEIDLGFHITVRGSLRIFGLYCPEIGKAKSFAERLEGLKAKQKAETLVPVGCKTQLQTIQATPADKVVYFEKYGRFLGNLAIPNGGDFADAMIKAGCGQAKAES